MNNGLTAASNKFGWHISYQSCFLESIAISSNSADGIRPVINILKTDIK